MKSGGLKLIRQAVMGKNKIKNTMRFTPDQVRAITTVDRPVCVSACAGSGKTTVLVERYAHLVLNEGVDPADMLAITFTDKAANNMRARLMAKFRQEDCPLHIQQLEGALICTIHSFCKTVLAEYPLEAGLVPSCDIIDGNEAYILKMKALDVVFARTDLDKDIVRLLSVYGAAALKDMLIATFHALCTYGKQWIDTDDDEVLALVFSSACENMRGALVEMQACSSTDKRSFPTAKCEAVNALLLYINESTEMPQGTEWLKTFLVLQKTVGSSTKYKLLFADFTYACARAAGVVAVKTSDAKVLYLALFRLFVAEYTALKNGACVLDFDDLLAHAYTVLSAETEVSAYIRQRYHARFRHVLVDEYQDTNALQARIVACIARTDSLFVVGDVRQSIYGFRGADVSVMMDTAEAFEKDARKELISLDLTHRSGDRLLAFINGFFDEVDQECGTRHFKAMETTAISPEGSAPVELLLMEIDPQHGEDSDSARFREGALIANRIRRLVDERCMVRGEDGQLRPVRYGDIAILFRAMTPVQIYERGLREHAVPYYVVKGGGFYQSQEIADVMNMLRIIEYAYDDLACAAVLRSPLVGISNDALFWIGQEYDPRNKKTFFSAVKRYTVISELFPDDRAKIAGFLSLYRTLLVIRDEAPLSVLIDVILRETQYDMKVMFQEHGARKYANLEKLREIAKKFDVATAFDLSGFIRYVEAMVRHEVEEEEASLDAEADDTVKMMTIHKAKGLEFPVVIIADMGARKNKPASGKTNFTEEHGFGMQVWVDGLQDYVPDHIYVANKRAQQAQELRETFRVMYVAMTRARDYLVCAGSIKWGKQGEKESYEDMATWMEMLLRYAGIEPDMTKPSVRLNCQNNAIVLECNHHNWQWRREDAQSHGTDACTWYDSGAGIMNDDDTARYACMRQNIAPYRAVYMKDRRFSVTVLAACWDEPEAFFEKYVREMPACVAVRRSVPPAVEKGTKKAVPYEGFSGSSREIGLAFHEIARKTDLKNIDQAMLLKECDYYANQLNDNEINILRSCVKGLALPQLRDVLCAGDAQCIETEVPFACRFDGFELKGQIDALLVYDDHVVVLDYKTSAVSDAGGIDTAYTIQMKLYALVCSRLLQTKEYRTVLFFPQTGKLVTDVFLESDLQDFEKEVIVKIENMVAYGPVVIERMIGREIINESM